MEAPKIRYRRQAFLKRRVDIDRPLGPAARMYKGRVPVVMAQLERRRALAPVQTVPITLHELRRQIDIERGMWDDPRDIPSALDPTQTVDTSMAVQRRPPAPETMPTEVVPPDEYGYQPHQGMSPTPIRGLGVTAIESRYSPRASAAEYSPKASAAEYSPRVYRPKRLDTPTLLAPVTALRGLGASDAENMATGAVILVLFAGGGYFAGAAMAPAAKDKVVYGALGAVLGLFTGPIGLGVLGAVALSKK